MMKTLEQRVADLEDRITPLNVRSADKGAPAPDQYLLDEVKLLLDTGLILLRLGKEAYWKSGIEDVRPITHYKVMKAYVEPTTFEWQVGKKVFVLNKPYMSSPELGAIYCFLDAVNALCVRSWKGNNFDYAAIKNHNCWKTSEDAEAYADVDLAHKQFLMGKIK